MSAKNTYNSNFHHNRRKSAVWGTNVGPVGRGRRLGGFRDRTNRGGRFDARRPNKWKVNEPTELAVGANIAAPPADDYDVHRVEELQHNSGYPAQGTRFRTAAKTVIQKDRLGGVRTPDSGPYSLAGAAALNSLVHQNIDNVGVQYEHMSKHMLKRVKIFTTTVKKGAAVSAKAVQWIIDNREAIEHAGAMGQAMWDFVNQHDVSFEMQNAYT